MSSKEKKIAITIIVLCVLAVVIVKFCVKRDSTVSVVEKTEQRKYSYDHNYKDEDYKHQDTIEFYEGFEYKLYKSDRFHPLDLYKEDGGTAGESIFLNKQCKKIENRLVTLQKDYAFEKEMKSYSKFKEALDKYCDIVITFAWQGGSGISIGKGETDYYLTRARLKDITRINHLHNQKPLNKLNNTNIDAKSLNNTINNLIQQVNKKGYSKSAAMNKDIAKEMLSSLNNGTKRQVLKSLNEWIVEREKMINSNKHNPVQQSYLRSSTSMLLKDIQDILNDAYFIYEK